MAQDQHSVHLVLGPPGSGKTSLCLERFCEQAPRPGEAGALFIVPTASAALAAQERLLKCTGGQPVWGEAVLTLADLAAVVHRALRVPVPRLIGERVRSLLLARLCEQGESAYFAQVRNLAGFHLALGHLFRELKAAGVTPDRFGEACAARWNRFPAGRGADWRSAARQKDEELAGLFKRYEDELKRLGLCDEEDLIHTGAGMLRVARDKFQVKWTAAVVDGFAEFSAVELALLDALRGICPVTVTLPHDPARPALQCNWAVARLVQMWPDCSQQFLAVEPRADVPSALAHLRQSLFAEGASRGSLEDGSLKFIEAPGTEGELEEVAREIRRLGQAGERLEQIVVVARGGDYVARAVRVLARYGLPVDASWQVPLAAAPVIRCLQSMLATVSDGWQREDVLNFLKSAYSPLSADQSDEIARAAREQGIFEGRDSWVRQLEVDPELRQRALGPLIALADALSGTAVRPDAFRDALTAWLRSDRVQQLVRGEEEDADPLPAAIDSHALLALDEVLRDIVSLMESGAEARKALVEHLLQMLHAGLFSQDVPVRWRQPGGVRVREVEQGIHESAEIVFIVGLQEGVFPRLYPDDAFYREWERTDRQQLGSLGLTSRSQRQQGERLLFAQVTAVPGKRLYLCCPNYDDAGNETLPSFYLKDGQALFNEQECETHTKRRDISQPLVDPREAAGEDDALRATLFALARRHTRPEAEAEGAALYNAVLADLSLGRRLRRALTSVREPEAQKLPVGIFAAPSRLSVTALERYAECPFHFFCTEVLGLQVEREGIGALEEGSLFHDLARRLMRGEQGPAIREWSRASEEEIRAQAESLLRKVMREHAAVLRERMPYRLLLAEQSLRLLLRLFISGEKRLQESGTGMVPRHAELSFGREPWSDSDPASTSEPLAIAGRGEPLLLTGKIDRVDADPGGRAVLYDYKKGRTMLDTRGVDAGLSLQLPAYWLAIERLWNLRPVAALLYLPALGPGQAATSGILDASYFQEVKSARSRDQSTQSRRLVDDCATFNAQVEAVLYTLWEGIAAGEFPCRPRSVTAQLPCENCDFRDVCRFDRWKRLEQQPYFQAVAADG